MAIATSKFCLMDAAYDAVENGITIPLVPSIEIPSFIPILGLSVFGPSSFPFGTEITTLIPFLLRRLFPDSLKFSIIIFFGTGLIAGLLISNPRPGLVTIPTPWPPSISISSVFSVIDNLTQISAPWVTSGSSPPSFITILSASSDPNLHDLIGISICPPFGNLISVFVIFF